MMKTAMAMMRMDFSMVRHVLGWKQMGFLAMICAVLTLGVSGFGMGFFIMFAAVYSSYPFALSEKSGLDFLYDTIPLSARDLVKGRYLFALVLGCAVTLACIMLSGLSGMMGHDSIGFTQNIVTLALLFFGFSILIFIQFPLFFKFGYTKSRFIIMLPGVAFAVVATGLSLSDGTQELEWFVNGLLDAGRGQIFAGLVVLWCLAMGLSFALSLQFVKKRKSK